MGATVLCHYSYWSKPNWIDLAMMFVNVLSMILMWLIATPRPYVMFVMRSGVPDRKFHYQYLWMTKLHAWLIIRKHNFHVYRDADHA